VSSRNSSEFSVGDALAPFLDDQLAVERATKTSLENRAVAVITGSGALVTLLFGLAAVVVPRAGFRLTLAPRVLLVAAVVAFIVAGLFGIYMNAPMRQYEVEPDSLYKLVTSDEWPRPGEEARRQLAAAKLEVLVEARKDNNAKARVLGFAAGAQAVAVVLTAGAVAATLV
jgi:hypothetical protein